MKPDARDKIIAAALFLILISATAYLAYNQRAIEQDYNTKINTLTENLSQKQEQIDELKSDLNTSDLQIEEIIKESEKTGLKIEDIEATTGQQITELNQQLSNLAVESESFTNIIPEIIDAVVSIVTDKGQGSGAIVTEDGVIITNYHVVSGTSQITAVLYNEERHNAELIGYNAEEDLALLQMTGQNFKSLKFGDSDDLKVGQKIVALGNPAGLLLL